MNDELLSVVVPVYNVKEYVEECITSILNQTYDNIELILVINGPTDGSDEICRRFAGEDKRIKLVEIKVNHGVYPARRQGVHAANGAHITFVDADDYIKPDYFQRLMKYKEYDLVTSGYDRIEQFGVYRVTSPFATGLYDSGEKLDYILSNMLVFKNQKAVSGIEQVVWAKLMKTNMIQGCLDEVDEDFAYTDDLVLCCCMALKCKQIYILGYSGYCYRIWKDSTSNSVIKNYLEEGERLYYFLLNIFEKHRLSGSLIDQLEQFMTMYTFHAGLAKGFREQNRIKMFFYPFVHLHDCKRIALYGSGHVGKEYYSEIKKLRICEIAVWVSKNWEEGRESGLDLSPVDSLLTAEYDYVVIAVEKEEMAKEIKVELIQLGMDKAKLLWKKPIYIVDL